jgi:hypothetical protein
MPGQFDQEEIHMWISPKFQEVDFHWPLCLDDKITLFEDQIRGWKLEIAEHMINGKSGNDEKDIQQPILHSGYAVLDVLLSYFEMIAKYCDGYTKHGKSSWYFKRGVHLVFPTLSNYPPSIVEELLDALYIGARCGLYHAGLTDSRIILTGQEKADLRFNLANEKLIINPHLLPKTLTAHLQHYIGELRDPNNIELRENFERRLDFDRK